MVFQMSGGAIPGMRPLQNSGDEPTRYTIVVCFKVHHPPFSRMQITEPVEGPRLHPGQSPGIGLRPQRCLQLPQQIRQMMTLPIGTKNQISKTQRIMTRHQIFETQLEAEKDADTPSRFRLGRQAGKGSVKAA